MKHVKLFEEYLQGELFFVVYAGRGASYHTPSMWPNFFREFFGVEPVLLEEDDFVYDNFSGADLIIIPGGSSKLESISMLESSKEGLKKYVAEGGKVVGICAGALLLSECYEWSLGIAKVGHDEEKHGVLESEFQAILDFEFTDAGKEVFATNLDSTKLTYHGGPVFDRVTEGEVLLKFNDVVTQKKGLKDYCFGKPAAVYSSYEKGHVIVISPHLEKADETEYLLSNALNYMLKK